MLKIFVDTCVWQNLSSFKSGKKMNSNEIEEDTIAFDKIIKVVLIQPKKFRIYYNACIEKELQQEHKSLFSSLQLNGLSTKAPIPLSRADGQREYKADGSLLSGGRYGHSLLKVLDQGGQNHKKKLSAALSQRGIDSKYYDNVRKKEFDIENLESALEAELDLFLTTDYKLIERLRRTSSRYIAYPLLIRALQICKRPVDAFCIFNKS